MSVDFLSQEEVDSLLKGITDDLDDDIRYKACNLGRQMRYVRGRLPVMELINDYTAKLLNKKLYSSIHRKCEISVGHMRTSRFSDFIRNTITPSSFDTVKSDLLNGYAYVNIDPNLVFISVDNLFGGDGRFHTRVEGCAFTPIENVVSDELLKCILDSFNASFKKFSVDVDFKFVEREISPRYCSVGDEDEVMTTQFTIEIAGTTADFTICIPYELMSPILPSLASRTSPDSMFNGNVVSVSGIPVECRVIQHVKSTTFGKISDVIELGKVTLFGNSEQYISIDGQRIFRCKMNMEKNEATVDEAELTDDWCAAMTDIYEADDSDLRQQVHKESTIRTSVIDNIPVTISVEIGRARMTIAEISELSSTSILELNDQQGEPVKVLANGKLIARGEVVIVNNHYGVKITSVL